ncbi:restriction endonuclease subunit S, partial [Leptotrichia wadei]|uniref:restriction endonuclease subunit S n=1 Tax=Leptotrichia wadei TaxID=157687 RepID=UPI00352CE1D3
MKFMEKLLVGEKVEWKTLGEVANCFSGGTPKTSNSSFYDGEIPWIRSGEINFNVIKKSERNITKEGLEKSSAKMIKKNSVVLAMTGATVGRTAVVEIETSSNQSVTAIETNNRIINYKYLFYFLAKEYNNLKKLGQGALTSLNLSIIKNIKIPVPSIETQEKIVKIFDSYTEYVTELQEKLKKELQARNKQYNYYRDMLLSEDYLNKISKKLDSLNYVLRLTTLGEIGKFTRGNGLQKKDFREKGKPVIHYGQIYTQYGFSTDKTISFAEENIFSKLRKAKPNDILIATTSENIEDVAKSTVWLGNEEVGFSGDMYSYSTNENSKYIAYYFQTAGFQKQKERKVTGTKLIRIHGEDMEKFTISLPPIEIQNKIVKILDRFQELLSDTKGLLPLEIEQRRKQYEYYREKLLTFDEGEGYA